MIDAESKTEYLNENIQRLTNLEQLFIVNNHTLDLEKLFGELRHLKKLEHLQLKDCKIRVTGNLKKLKNIRKLVLIRNKLTVIPLDFISSLFLDELIVGEEGFVFTGQLSSRTSLKSLDFSGNNEQRLNKELFKLKQLAQLSVFNSDLHHLSPRIVQMASLNKLSILACPLSRNRDELSRLREMLQGKCEIITDENYKSSAQ